MLSIRSLEIGMFILTAIGGFMGLIFSLLQIDFKNNPSSIKATVLVIFALIYLLVFLVLILFLKVYEKPKDNHQKK